MPSELTADTDIPFTSFQVVNGADVVKPTTSHVIARGSVRTGHDPGGAQGDGVHLQHTQGGLQLQELHSKGSFSPVSQDRMVFLAQKQESNSCLSVGLF